MSPQAHFQVRELLVLSQLLVMQLFFEVVDLIIGDGRANEGHNSNNEGQEQEESFHKRRSRSRETITDRPGSIISIIDNPTRIIDGLNVGCSGMGRPVALSMKSGDIVIYLFGAVLVFITWSAFGPSATNPGGSGAPAEVKMAVASKLPVLIEFGATWCPPCQQVKPLIHELAAELKGRAHILQVDVDERHEYSALNGVRSIPCFIALKDGKEVARQVGAISKTEMRRMLGL